MGGQACVFYGAAEFSRDVDFAILAEPENLRRLQAALDELQAEVIAIPAFEESFLHRGLAIHFRCQAPGVEGLRVDVMTVMRGVDPFPELWERRTTIAFDENEADLLSLPDLVKAKKTQRARDWPMLTRLVEAHWFQNRSDATPFRRHTGPRRFLVTRVSHPGNPLRIGDLVHSRSDGVAIHTSTPRRSHSTRF
jgi:hypothetical protein